VKGTMIFDINLRGLKKDSEHHVVPKSRCKNQLKHNKVKVNRRLHECYHSLFENRTPEEIIEFLSTYFWGNKYEITITKK